jgi:hypothetical protein
MIVKKFKTFREGSATRSRLTTRVHSARRSQRQSASIPARTSGREQPSGPGPGSTPCPNRGVAHAPMTVRAASAEQRTAQSAVRRSAPRQAGGTDRRPTTTARNLRSDLRLPCALSVRQSLSSTWRIPRRAAIQGGTPRARPCSPSVFPLETLIELGRSVHDLPIASDSFCTVRRV